MTPTAVSDAELLGQARAGDEAAFTELYVRHQAAAQRLANAYSRAGDPDDLVNESFERVLAALRRGSGPTESFRAYLFVTLRRLAADRISRRQDDPVEQVPEPIRAEEATPPLDPTDRQLVVTAYESLPERWQAVLWQTAVEGRQPRDLAPALGMTANAAAALAYRAREKLRQAYLQAHLQAAPRPSCEPHRSRLGAYVRDGLSRRDRGATELHLDRCSSCRALVGELADVNRMLVRSLVPLFVAAGSHLAIGAAATTGTAAVSGTGVGAGAAALARRVGQVGRKARANPTVLVGVVLVAALAFALIVAPGRDDDPVGQPESPDESAPSSPGGPAPASPDDPATPDEPGAPDDPADPDRPDDPDSPMVPIVAITPTTIPGVPADPGAPTVPGAPPVTSPGDPDPGPGPDPEEPGTPPTSPPPTSPPPTSPPTTQPPPSTPYLLVVWIADVAELRVTLNNPTSTPTAALVLEVELGGGARMRSAPRGCGLLTTLLSGSTCGLESVPPGGSRTVSVPVNANGSRPTAEVSLCQARLLSLRCDGGLVGSLVAVLV